MPKRTRRRDPLDWSRFDDELPWDEIAQEGDKVSATLCRVGCPFFSKRARGDRVSSNEGRCSGKAVFAGTTVCLGKER